MCPRGGWNIPLEDEDEFRRQFPHWRRRIPHKKRRHVPRRIPLRRRRVEDIFPEDKFRSEDEFPREDKFPSKEEDEDTSPEDEFPGKAEFPSEDKDEDIFCEDALPSEDKDEKTLSPKTRCCCKGRGALLRRERGGIERRGEVLYNERAKCCYETRDRNESGGCSGKASSQCVVSRHVSPGQDRECAVSRQSLR